MRIIDLLLLTLSSLLSCNTREPKAKVHIYNRSSASIDSINISYSNLVIREKIDTGQEGFIDVDVPKSSSADEGPLLLFVYQSAHIFKASWGFCDFGTCIVNNNPIYVFDNGISYTDEPPKMPKEFTLYVTNMTKTKIDSVYSAAGTIVRQTDLSNSTKQVVLNFSRIKENPILISQSGKQFKADLSFHDFRDWNSNQATVFVYEDGVFNKEK